MHQRRECPNSPKTLEQHEQRVGGEAAHLKLIVGYAKCCYPGALQEACAGFFGRNCMSSWREDTQSTAAGHSTPTQTHAPSASGLHGKTKPNLRINPPLRAGCKSFSNSQAQTIMLWRTQPLQCTQKDADALADDVQLPCSQAKQLSFFRACQGSFCMTGKKVKTEGWFASLYLFSKSTISSSKHLFSKSTISFSKTNPISKSTPGSDAIAWSSLCCQPAE